MGVEPSMESPGPDNILERVEEGPLAETLAVIHTNDAQHTGRVIKK
jgi:hypothetical protein